MCFHNLLNKYYSGTKINTFVVFVENKSHFLLMKLIRIFSTTQYYFHSASVYTWKSQFWNWKAVFSLHCEFRISINEYLVWQRRRPETFEYFFIKFQYTLLLLDRNFTVNVEKNLLGTRTKIYRFSLHISLQLLSIETLRLHNNIILSNFD